MAVSITYKNTGTTNKSYNANAARGLKIATGELNFSGLTYPTTGGVTTNFAGFASIYFCGIDADQGLEFEYDYTNAAIFCRAAGAATWTSTIAAGENLAATLSNVTLGSWTNVRFFVIGR